MQNFPIDTVLHPFNQLILLEPCDSSLGSRLRDTETIHELLGLKFIGQFAETFFVATCAATLYELLVLVGEVVERHFAKEELLMDKKDIRQLNLRHGYGVNFS